jgi:hypothetical protein
VASSARQYPNPILISLLTIFDHRLPIAPVPFLFQAAYVFSLLYFLRFGCTAYYICSRTLNVYSLVILFRVVFLVKHPHQQSHQEFSLVNSSAVPLKFSLKSLDFFYQFGVLSVNSKEFEVDEATSLNWNLNIIY